MSNLKNPQDALVHPALKGQAKRMIELYLQGERFEKFFEQCGIPYTNHTRKLFDQCRHALGIPKLPNDFGCAQVTVKALVPR